LPFLNPGLYYLIFSTLNLNPNLNIYSPFLVFLTDKKNFFFFFFFTNKNFIFLIKKFVEKGNNKNLFSGFVWCKK
jgi:hypothetical protein